MSSILVPMPVVDILGPDEANPRPVLFMNANGLVNWSLYRAAEKVDITVSQRPGVAETLRPLEEKEQKRAYRERQKAMLHHMTRVAIVTAGLLITHGGFKRDEIEDAVAGAKLHDNFKSAMLKIIYGHNVSLEQAEWYSVEQHPHRGAARAMHNLLRNGVDPERAQRVVAPILCHHLFQDHPYPIVGAVKFSDLPDWQVEILTNDEFSGPDSAAAHVAVADGFDSACSQRTNSGADWVPAACQSVQSRFRGNPHIVEGLYALYGLPSAA